MRAVLWLILDLIVMASKCLRRGGKSQLIAELLLVRQQLVTLRRKRRKAPALTPLDRVVFAVSSLFIGTKRLPRLSITVAHSTLLGFHRALVNRKYSKLFSSQGRRKPGPKGPDPLLIQLIVEIKTKNPRYGCPRISLLVSKLLGQEIHEQTVRRILRKHYLRPPAGSGPSWLNAIGNAKDVLWSMDLFCCESISLQTHWVMVVMDHFTREIIGVAVSAGSLEGDSICRMFTASRGRTTRKPRHLSTDHDPLFNFHRWRANLRVLEIDEIKTVPEIPWSHPFIERAIGTIRRELLDEIFFWGERDLQSKLDQYVIYYNEARVHSSIYGNAPQGLSGTSQLGLINIRNYAWKTYCGDRFSIPIAV